MRTLLPLLLPLAACGGADAGDAATCTDPSGLDAGAVHATLDGAEWDSTATWLYQGESVQITVATADGVRMTLVAQAAADGSTPLAAIEAGSFPVEFALEEGGGGWALVYPEDGSRSTDYAGGTLAITALADDVLDACFDFVAASEDGVESEVSGGALRALPFEM